VIGFGMRQHLGTVQESHRRGVPLELLCSVQENHWNGNSSLQLRARDLRLQQG
jgi:single-stranded-DNA-specific exonuclease